MKRKMKKENEEIFEFLEREMKKKKIMDFFNFYNLLDEVIDNFEEENVNDVYNNFLYYLENKLLLLPGLNYSNLVFKVYKITNELDFISIYFDEEMEKINNYFNIQFNVKNFDKFFVSLTRVFSNHDLANNYLLSRNKDKRENLFYIFIYDCFKSFLEDFISKNDKYLYYNKNNFLNTFSIKLIDENNEVLEIFKKKDIKNDIFVNQVNLTKKYNFFKSKLIQIKFLL